MQSASETSASGNLRSDELLARTDSKKGTGWLQTASMVGGPLAHPVEQGTFNPKVRGSRPRRPTEKS